MVWYQRKQNKYGNTSHEYNGRIYHSIKEAAYAQDLDLLKKAGEITDWEPQFHIDLVANGIKICTMVPDFKVTMPDGSIELHEVKGFGSAEWRLKRKILEATYLHDHPEVKYLVIT